MFIITIISHYSYQKVIENEKKFQEILEIFICIIIKIHDINHVTLGHRMKGGKSIAESHEDQQNLSIPEENALS